MNTKRSGPGMGVLWLISGIIAGAIGMFLLRGSYERTEPARAAVPTVDERKPQPASVAATSWTDAERNRSPSPGQPPSLIAIPEGWQFAGVGATQSGKNDSDWLSHYTATEFETIRHFNRLHPYAWTVHSPAQIAWMAQNGFPMPEDMFAAERMSDAELKSWADRGNAKAKLLYYDRLMIERADAIDQLRRGGNAGQFAAMQPELEAEWQRMYKAASSVASPFFGYLEAARAVWLDDSESRAQAFAGGLAVAYFRGDNRAASALNAAPDAGYLTAREAAIAYRIASQIRDYYPLPSNCGASMSTPFPRAGG